MTKQETIALLEAVKNAPIVNGTITVTVCGTTFSFGGRTWNGDRFVTEENRKEWLDIIERTCKKRYTSSITKKELDRKATDSQNHLLWWKDNISKMDDVARVEKKRKEFDKKWGRMKFADMTDLQCKERKSEHKLIKSEENKLGIEYLDIHLLMYVRQEIPKSWMRA